MYKLERRTDKGPIDPRSVFRKLTRAFDLVRGRIEAGGKRQAESSRPVKCGLVDHCLSVGSARW